MVPLTRRQAVAIGLGAAAVASAAASASAAPLDLRRGVNLWPWFSLTREYPAPRTDYAWPPFQAQRPVPRPEDLARLKAAGFDFVRLPVDPGPFLAAAPDRRRDLMTMLEAAVGSLRAAGLAVVVNLQPNEATHYWVSERMVGDLGAPAFPSYRDLVVEVASRLAGFDPVGMALEPMNEPAGACASSAWPAVQRALLAAARHAAPKLTLVATGACGSMVPGLAALDPVPLLGFAPLLFTFHFYEPYLFSHQGAPWMREPVYRDLNGVPWPASAGSLDRTLAAAAFFFSFYFSFYLSSLSIFF